MTSNNFIYGKFIDKKICDNIINYFEKNKKEQDEVVLYSKDEGLVENPILKKSIEILIPCQRFFEIFPEYGLELLKILRLYQKKYIFSNIGQHNYNIKGNVKIQKYNPNEGFYNWHFENDGLGENGKRHLVFMTYLNDVDDGGTEFLYQKKLIKAKKGYTIIWPSQWTHTHKGQISKTKEKYIVTGWYFYND